MSPLDAELLALMHEEVTIEHKVGVDKFNNFTYSDPVTVKCMIVTNVKRGIGVDGRVLASRDGREVVVTANIFLDPTVVVGPHDRVTLPDGSQPAIQEIHAADDETGAYYSEIRL